MINSILRPVIQRFGLIAATTCQPETHHGPLQSGFRPNIIDFVFAPFFVQALLGSLHRSLGPFEIDIGSALGRFRQDRDFIRQRFRKSPADKNKAFFATRIRIMDDAGFKRSQKWGVPHKDAEFTKHARRGDDLRFLIDNDFLGCYYFEPNIPSYIQTSGCYADSISLAASTTSSMLPRM